MNSVPAVQTNGGEVMESVLLKGDLSKLTSQERADYYLTVCRTIGLNPTTQPLAFITLNGKMVLYALRAASDQLRKIHSRRKHRAPTEFYDAHVWAWVRWRRFQDILKP